MTTWLADKRISLYSTMLHSAWIYILTNRHDTVLYIGVTTDLPTRLWEHTTKQNPKCFTARYNCYKLVYYEGFETIIEAIEREKYLKGKSRKWKEDLIKTINIEWVDLTEEVSSAIRKTARRSEQCLPTKPSS